MSLPRKTRKVLIGKRAENYEIRERERQCRELLWSLRGAWYYARHIGAAIRP